MKQEIEFIEPLEAALVDKIKLYYFHSTEEEDYQNNITYYPNFSTTLNIYKNSSVEWSAYERTHRHQLSDKLLMLLVGKIDRARKIELIGPQQKITIVFNPLGLNNFVATPLSNLIQAHFSFFDYYGTPFHQVIEKVFDAPNLMQKRDLLDEFFLTQLDPFQEDRLVNTVQHIIETEDPIQINQLAKTVGISRRTLLRLFKKHLSYSIEEYISVVKFRKAFMKNQIQKTSLTRLAFEANYYDQSDFIKNFKLKSGETPKQLFANLKQLEKELFWKVE